MLRKRPPEKRRLKERALRKRSLRKRPARKRPLRRGLFLSLKMKYSLCKNFSSVYTRQEDWATIKPGRVFLHFCQRSPALVTLFGFLRDADYLLYYGQVYRMMIHMS